MTRRAKGFVESITTVRPGVQEILVRVENPCAAGGDTLQESERRPAINLTELTGELVVGDHVEVNTVAIDMNLGTGGFDFVISVLNRTALDL